MTTRPERTHIEAAIIGDSHAMAVWKHLAPGTVFRRTMTAPAKHFDGRFFAATEGGIRITADGLGAAFPRATAEVIATMTLARQRLDAQLQAIIEAGLPVISSLGAASYRFARRVAASAEDGMPGASGRILRAAAADHIQHVVAFHEALRAHVPAVTFMLGACRYPPNQKAAWLAHDQVMTERLTAAGIGIIDTRQATGDAELRMLPEFEADDALHGNARWCEVVADRIRGVVGAGVAGG